MSEKLFTCGERLRVEREKLGISQTALGDAAQTGKRTVINWEQGSSSPDAEQLAALAVIGVDVLYVITGETAADRATDAMIGDATARALKMSGTPAQQSAWRDADVNAQMDARPVLSADEQKLIKAVRQCEPSDRAAVLRHAEALVSRPMLHKPGAGKVGSLPAVLESLAETEPGKGVLVVTASKGTSRPKRSHKVRQS